MLFAMMFIALLMMNVWSDLGDGALVDDDDGGDGDDITFGSLRNVLCEVKKGIEELLGPIAFLLVVMAAVIYAGGQLGDAQLRAKAQGWAVGALVGAIIAFVLYAVGPTIITKMFGATDCPP